MRTNITTNHRANGGSADLADLKKANVELDTEKEQWLQQYSDRLLKLWHQWQTPLGVACSYAQQIRTDLAEFYEDPLKRRFIENTYRGLSAAN